MFFQVYSTSHPTTSLPPSGTELSPRNPASDVLNLPHLDELKHQYNPLSFNKVSFVYFNIKVIGLLLQKI
jgi:hypothetical protein